MVLEWTKMDPQSYAFVPQNNDIWRLSTAMRTFQETQQEHSERLARLERQRDDDARMKSVWGPASPFPGILSGTPQHGPVQHPTVDFANFDDDHSNSMVRSLHLDADEEPRRYPATSRANSVRFDDSAKPGQWAHASRSSVDLPSRGGSGFGGLPLFERSASHKSDGKSSMGQASRANSLMLDTSSQPYTPAAEEPPSLAPGLLILGSVPSIIRCWLTDNFKHDTLLYAAICTGSYKSYVDSRMIDFLGLSRQVGQDLSGDRKIKLSVYLPEAVPMPASSRSSSPSSQLPSVLVDFTVTERSSRHADSKAIQIFIGSDVLRAHNADILFSSNVVTLFDDERSKLSIPLVRPENHETFKGLFCTSAAPVQSRSRPGLALDTKSSEQYPGPNGLNGIFPHRPPSDVAQQPLSESAESIRRSSDEESQRVMEPIAEPVRDIDVTPKPLDVQSSGERPYVGTRRPTEAQETVAEEHPPISSTSRSASSTAMWGSWRRDSSTTNAASPADWTGRNGSTTLSRPNRDQGIKVLKPARTISRSTASPLPASPVTTGQSRFFDDGKRKESGGSVSESQAQPPAVRRSLSGDSARGMALGREGMGPPRDAHGRDGKDGKDGASTSQQAGAAPKPRSTNPIGGASAFGWLNSGGK